MNKYNLTPDYTKDSLFDSYGMQRLKDSYMKPEESSPQDRFIYVCNQFASNKEHAERLYQYCSNHWLSLSTPILAFGKDKRGLGISCYLSWLEDSREGLVDTLAETSWLSMLGGGIGIGIGIRSADDKSVGLMPHLKTYDACCLAYKQNTTRRGSYAIYLDISHPDILNFIEMRKPTGDQDNRCLNLHHGVNIPDKFMEIIKRCMTEPDANDDWELIDPHTGEVKSVVSAKYLWQKLLEIRMQTGEPYFHFIDTSNAKLPQHLKDKGLRVRQSNLCVSGDTRILTINGWEQIETLENKNVVLWNGEEWSDTKIYKTGENKKLLKVVLNSGQELKCTPEHTFYVVENYGQVPVKKQAKDLLDGDKLIKFDLPVINKKESWPLDLAYFSGFYTGDGCLVGNKQRIYFYDEKKNLIPLAEKAFNTKIKLHPGNNREQIEVTNLWEKFFVPSQFSTEVKLSWLAGLCDADGTVSRNGDNQSIQIGSVNKEFLLEIQLMLQTLGVQSKLNYGEAPGYRTLPDGKGGHSEYYCQQAYRLLISSYYLHKLVLLGFKTNRLIITDFKPQRNCENFMYVTTVEEYEGLHDTFCFTEPKRNMGMFNGMLAGNCQEITLPTDKDRTAVCCLSSVNLEYWDDWKDDKLFIRDCVEMLDNVLSYFIANGPKEISRAIYSAQQERSIGLGTLGFHSLLQKKNIPFESALATSLNLKVFKHIQAEAEEANLQLGKERGEAPDIESDIIIEDEQGNTKIIRSSSFVKVIRDKKELTIRAFELQEEDELVIELS